MKNLKQSHVSILGSSVAVTKARSEVENRAPTGWMPKIYRHHAITDSGQDLPEREPTWVDLAASARRDWFADHPF